MSALAVKPLTRQELYERMAETSRDEVILEEMIRFGFWPAQGEVPFDPADEIRRRGELHRALDELRAEQRKLGDEAKLRKEARKKRLLESRRKQQETIVRRETERIERATQWQEKKSKEIGYLGAGVSAGLDNKEANVERLQRYNLPRFDDAASLAQAMGLTVGALRFLSFARKTSKTTHYVRFALPKKTGGVRVISAPMPRLKAAQHWVLQNILQPVELHEAAHGFRPQRSIVSNARPHVASSVVINLDLKDFFPTLDYRRIKGVFRALGYAEATATILGLLCTEPEVEKVELDGETYYVATSARHLPQGAPTSPALTNILCRRLDRRLLKVAEEMGFVYTRYADDMTFSTKQEQDSKQIGRLLHRVESIVAHEGFCIHPTKTRIMRSASKQDVTGIIVNDKPSIDKATMKRFRAVLFQVEKDGPIGKQWNHSRDVLASLRGFANFIFMVDPAKGAAYQRRVGALIDKYDWKPQPLPYQKKTKPVEPPAPQPVAQRPWWKLW
ncbi:MAG: RNA-directed DNA polymerase [Acidobacteria bacterium]|nr:RNA-directed DNA polymerase [Acidobacteriota bacterium]